MAIEMESESNRRLTAFRLPGYESYPEIVPAPIARDWMEVETKGWANRCLPLRVANQAGWLVLNDADFEVIWSGSKELSGVRIVFDKGQHSEFVRSMFGYGVVTWTIPYLFRTSPGVNMIARGPTNTVKDGIAALDGLIETDWLPYPFTMNWKLTRKMKWVRFQRGEPICMLMPSPRGYLEAVRPEVRNLASESELLEKYDIWHQSRVAAVDANAGALARPDPELKQGFYIRGEDHGGVKAPEHQLRLDLKPFVELEPPPEQPGATGPIAAGQPRSFWARLRGA